jgi:branched-chain amino acid transport system permease protein
MTAATWRTVVLAALGVAVVAAVASDGHAVQAALLGAGSGALIAALALGVVVTYRGSGVVNIATGAIAMYSSFVFNSLFKDGKLLFFGWLIDVGGIRWPFGLALLVTVLMGGVLGGVLYLLVFAPLRNASPIAKLVASVGVLLVLQAIIVLRYGAQSVTVTAKLSDNSVKLPGGAVVPVNQLIMVGVVVVVAAVLAAIYKYTGMGRATRAAAEDERRLMILGRSPLLVSGGNWVFSSMVVALFGVLFAPVNGTIDPSTITLLVVPGLAAALLGRFTSFGLAAAAGLVIGMVQALVVFYGTDSWFPKAAGSPIPGVRETVPLVLILAAFLFWKTNVGGRGAIGNVRLPFAPEPRHVPPKVLVTAAIGVGGFFLLGPAWRLAEINTLVGIALCLSLVVLVGFVGQVSLAHMALAGFAGFSLAKVSESAGLNFPIAPIIGALAATVVGVLIAIPALRMRGAQLAIVTLAAGLAIENLVSRNPVWSDLGGATVAPPSIFGHAFGPTNISGLGDGTIPDPLFGIVCVVIVALLAWFTCGLRSSRWGRRMLAVRANERAAAAAGIRVSQTKILSFAVSAFVAGMAGALSGYRFGSVTPDYFSVLASLTFLAFAYMGGISSVTGAVIGGLMVTNGLMFTVLDRGLGLAPAFAPLVGGLGLILTVIMNPEGIAGGVAATWRKLRQGRQRAEEAPA